MNSRQKGKRGELEARDQVREHWGSSECIRSAQVSGKFSADLMKALPGTHVEVKYHKKIACFRFLEQAEKDKEDNEIPVLLMRETGRKKWLVAFPIEYSRLFAKLINDQDRNDNSGV